MVRTQLEVNAAAGMGDQGYASIKGMLVQVIRQHALEEGAGEVPPSSGADESISLGLSSLQNGALHEARAAAAAQVAASRPTPQLQSRCPQPAQHSRRADRRCEPARRARAIAARASGGARRRLHGVAGESVPWVPADMLQHGMHGVQADEISPMARDIIDHESP